MQDHSDTVDVGPFVHAGRLPESRLGRHVPGSPQVARVGLEVRRLAVLLDALLPGAARQVGPLRRLRQAPVDDDDLAELADDDVELTRSAGEASPPVAPCLFARRLP